MAMWQVGGTSRGRVSASPYEPDSSVPRFKSDLPDLRQAGGAQPREGQAGKGVSAVGRDGPGGRVEGKGTRGSHIWASYSVPEWDAVSGTGFKAGI